MVSVWHIRINFDLFGHDISKNERSERYDIVIFKYPDDESQLFIKGVIGLPGDTVEIRGTAKFLSTDVEDETQTVMSETPTGNYGPYVVPEEAISCLEIIENIPRIPDSGRIRL